ncbi:hypothetical protein HDU89_006766 [Geranomyces variabilis]|nr:hypothetical protein HDU89_006766 [Geranomyces variabilis]
MPEFRAELDHFLELCRQRGSNWDPKTSTSVDDKTASSSSGSISTYGNVFDGKAAPSSSGIGAYGRTAPSSSGIGTYGKAAPSSSGIISTFGNKFEGQTAPSTSGIGAFGNSKTSPSISGIGAFGISKTSPSSSRIVSTFGYKFDGQTSPSSSRIGAFGNSKTSPSTSRIGAFGNSKTPPSTSGIIRTFGNKFDGQTSPSSSRIGAFVNNKTSPSTSRVITTFGNKFDGQTSPLSSRIGAFGNSKTSSSTSRIGAFGNSRTSPSTSRIGAFGNSRTSPSSSRIGAFGISKTSPLSSGIDHPEPQPAEADASIDGLAQYITATGRIKDGYYTELGLTDKLFAELDTIIKEKQLNPGSLSAALVSTGFSKSHFRGAFPQTAALNCRNPVRVVALCCCMKFDGEQEPAVGRWDDSCDQDNTSYTVRELFEAEEPAEESSSGASSSSSTSTIRKLLTDPSGTVTAAVFDMLLQAVAHANYVTADALKSRTIISELIELPHPPIVIEYKDGRQRKKGPIPDAAAQRRLVKLGNYFDIAYGFPTMGTVPTLLVGGTVSGAYVGQSAFKSRYEQHVPVHLAGKEDGECYPVTHFCAWSTDDAAQSTWALSFLFGFDDADAHARAAEYAKNRAHDILNEYGHGWLDVAPEDAAARFSKFGRTHADCVRGGRACYELKVGVFDPKYAAKRPGWVSKGGSMGTPEQFSAKGKIGGPITQARSCELYGVDTLTRWLLERPEAVTEAKDHPDQGQRRPQQMLLKTLGNDVARYNALKKALVRIEVAEPQSE